MLLHIEDNDGAVWTVCEDIEKIDLSTTEGKEQLANLVSSTLEQVKEETEEYQNLQDEDSIFPSSIDLDQDGSIPYITSIGLAEDLPEESLEVTDALGDEIDL